eukprot:TRINITY_DN3559_c0_g1_i5.p2 TRINITY_DN3559_c0_g1~~TRINITY_DN3559_c0_g1_i5.p2  ORF type:complete len:149 (-),score=24.28 TRINITY_DN3559_c0_g1_i5:91-537(-)
MCIRDRQYRGGQGGNRGRKNFKGGNYKDRQNQRPNDQLSERRTQQSSQVKIDPEAFPSLPVVNQENLKIGKPEDLISYTQGDVIEIFNKIKVNVRRNPKLDQFDEKKVPVIHKKGHLFLELVTNPTPTLAQSRKGSVHLVHHDYNEHK